MDRSEAVARIKRGLGFRTDLDDTIVTQLQESQRQLERGRSLPWFLVVESEALSITSGSGEIALPTRFIREKPREGLYYYSSVELENVFLEKIDLNIGIARFANSSAGKPRAYTLRSETLKFYPTRDTTYSATWSYYKGAEVLTSDVENLWLEHGAEALIGHAGMTLAKDLRDKDAVALFSEMHVEGWKGVFAHGIERELDNQPLYIGGQL
jgi:hypothetical protein